MKYQNKERSIEFTTLLDEGENASVFHHFKNKDYRIITIAKHSETLEELVVYHEIGNMSHCCARPIDMFFSKVDKEKYPEVTQEYRFEKIK